MKYELRDKVDKVLRQEGLTYEEVINNPDYTVIERYADFILMDKIDDLEIRVYGGTRRLQKEDK